ncbi:hypothetical protein F4782DRAFT_398284 [Xylaria castorea]|nr:hypothetical protein F4782DRAFT_398284 [Xylaria castorea]
MESTQTEAAYYNFQGALYSIPWILTAISVLTSVTVTYFRRTPSGKISSDDWVMLVAVIFQIVYQTFITIVVQKGAGKTMPSTFTPDQLVDLLKWSWFSNPFGPAVSVTARLSIAIFLVRIFGVRRWYKWFMIIFTSMVLILGILNIIIVWFQTHPVQALWDFRIMVPRWNASVQQIFQSVLQAYLTASDLLFALLPVVFIWKLNTNSRRKIELTLVMALSVITFAFALVKLIFIIGAISSVHSILDQTTDAFYLFSLLTLITGVEQNLVIILGYAPKLYALRKLETRIFSRFSSSVRSLLGMTTKGSSLPSSSASTQKPHPHADRARYWELETQPPFLRSDKINQIDTAVIYNTSPAKSGLEFGDNGIIRTDHFTIVDNSTAELKNSV